MRHTLFINGACVFFFIALQLWIY